MELRRIAQADRSRAEPARRGEHLERMANEPQPALTSAVAGGGGGVRHFFVL
jgi:hypothetical protein